MSLAFEQQADLLLEALDAVVDEGSEADLFIASYLHGHVSLAISQVLLAEQGHADALDSQVQHSLKQAFANNELGAAEQVQVYRLWQRLRQRFLNQA